MNTATTARAPAMLLSLFALGVVLRAPVAPRRHAAVSMCDPFDMNVLKERIKKQNDGTEQVKMIILDAMVPGQRLALTVTKNPRESLGILPVVAERVESGGTLAMVGVDPQRRRVMDRDAKNRTALRKERLDRLETAGLVADGPALAPQLLLTNGNNEDSLNRAVACYCCKAPFSELHHFYAALCPACASLNFAKRTQTADLRGRGALVTGARVKIGFRVALKLLRAGATVVATSRFPADAAARYAAEADAEEWRDRLRVVGCDFRDLGAVEALCAAVPELLGCGLDVLVCVESTSVSGARALVRRAVRNEHHAIEQVSRRWRGGRRGDSGQTRRKFDFHTGPGEQRVPDGPAPPSILRADRGTGG